LLGGLRELLDGPGGETALNDAIANYDEMKGLVKPPPPAAAGARKPTKSATGVLLGSPIPRSRGMTGEISSRKLTLQPGKGGRPPQMTGAAGRWSRWRDCRSLPAYISAQSISEAITDLLVPNSAGDTTMTEIQDGIKALPNWMPTLKTSLQALANNAGQDIKLFRTSVENWYDDHMSRVSGWYKPGQARQPPFDRPQASAPAG
jgi:hypothetical protein